jgi:hypothetical protein
VCAGETTDAVGLLAGRGGAIGDGFADRFPATRLARLLKARLSQASLSKAAWVDQGNMQKNADYEASMALDFDGNMHYCA